MIIYRDPVRWIVVHPTKGSRVVEARCKLEALLLAAAEMDLTAAEEKDCKIGIHNEDRDKPKINDS